MPRKAHITPADILLVAEQQLRQHGVRALSLEKLARSVGISKSGLLHHYPSKEALLHALMTHAFRMGEDEVGEQLAQEPDAGQRGRYTRAYINSNLAMIRDGRAHQVAVFVELAIAEPAIIAAHRECFHQLRAALENDGLDPTMAHIIANASDNLWFQVLFGVLAPDDPHIEKVHQRLVDLTY
jgi:AcrR family transcriptional regulator